MEPLTARFSANLKRQRRAADLSQDELASRAGVYRTEISLIERGRRAPALGTIVKLAGSLDVPPGALLEGIAWRPSTPGEPGRFEITPCDGDQPGPPARR